MIISPEVNYLLTKVESVEIEYYHVFSSVRRLFLVFDCRAAGFFRWFLRLSSSCSMTFLSVMICPLDRLSTVRLEVWADAS